VSELYLDLLYKRRGLLEKKETKKPQVPNPKLNSELVKNLAGKSKKLENLTP
jgi:hypothetical protein